MENWRQYKPKQYFDNARLAVELAIELGAKGTSAGTMSNFSATPPDWECPGCRRTKSQIARLNKHGEFYCALHLHHDHIGDGICDVLGVNYFTSPQDFRDYVDRYYRFSGVTVCMDCNRIDAQAKRLVGSPRHFSFSAKEISEFVIVAPRVSHKINEDEARRVFVEALHHFDEIVEGAVGVIRSYEPEMLDRAVAART